MNRLQYLDGINHIDGLKPFAEKVISHCSRNDHSPVAESSNKVTEIFHGRIQVKPMIEDDAQACIVQFLSESDLSSKNIVPLHVIKALSSLIRRRNLGEAMQQELEQLLSSHAKHLQFARIQSPSPSSLNNEKENRKYKQRIERLKILVEENRYRQITSNLDKTVKDDTTMKSMMYATSVGLNMIVAPLSFGAFMYFFSGALLDRFFVSNHQGDTNIGSKTGPDIRRVIAGVISGVLMLFIEMILFVIRNHEMDTSIRKKSRARKENPFGYSKMRAKKTFT